MRTKLYMIALVAMTMILALSACSESEDLLSAFHSDPNAVRITAEVGKASANGFTRSYPLGATEADQKKFKEGDMISVKADGQDAVTYQLNGNEWQPQGGKFLKWESDKMNFTAYTLLRSMATSTKSSCLRNMMRLRSLPTTSCRITVCKPIPMAINLLSP